MKPVLKRVVRTLLPKPALKGIQQWRSRRVDSKFASLTPEQTFERIYAEGYWGICEDGCGTSGNGSHQSGVVQPTSRPSSRSFGRLIDRFESSTLVRRLCSRPAGSINGRCLPRVRPCRVDYQRKSASVSFAVNQLRAT